jgi:proteasome lid subunit RPN8/RPN11
MTPGPGLLLPAAAHAQVVAHCQEQYPKEACGLLAGPRGKAERRVIAVYPMRNVEDSPIGYSMDPREQLQVERRMRQDGQALLGIYHSHTASEAYPSSVDVGLAISPEVSYVLVSLKDRQRPVIKSYRIDGRTVLPEELRLV